MDTNTKAVAQRYSRGPYKRHPVAFKRAVVEASLAPGASVSRVTREHDINASQVFLWRRLYRDGLLNAGEPALLPVSFEPPAHVGRPRGKPHASAGRDDHDRRSSASTRNSVSPSGRPSMRSVSAPYSITSVPVTGRLPTRSTAFAGCSKLSLPDVS
ncbi:transposase [Stutzerimonas stutzeri]|uniref:transposase n=1 Tax=Stutzerimonas stutzeri TaxID=316 RepID=UPI0037CCE6B5